LSDAIATLQDGEGVYVLGETVLDTQHKMDSTHTAVPNDGSVPGIEYARVKTQSHGDGWVATYFLASGAGNAVSVPAPAPAPMTTTGGMSTLQKVLLGGVIGSAVAGGGLLVWKAVKTGGRRLAYA
jgi:hypothetical protein